MFTSTYYVPKFMLEAADPVEEKISSLLQSLKAHSAFTEILLLNLANRMTLGNSFISPCLGFLICKTGIRIALLWTQNGVDIGKLP